MVDKKFNQRALLQECFLLSLGVDAAATYPGSFMASCGGFPSVYKELSVHHRSSFLGGLVHLQCVKGYQMEFAAWSPRSRFESLVSLLGDRGPAVAFGNFGQKCNNAPPLLLAERADHHPIHGWRPSSAKAQNSMVGHAITLVGCEQRDGGKPRIYYIDPDDGSSAHQQRKIYTLSYESFITRCADAYGICGPSPTPNGYPVTRKP